MAEHLTKDPMAPIRKRRRAMRVNRDDAPMLFQAISDIGRLLIVIDDLRERLKTAEKKVRTYTGIIRANAARRAP